MKIVLNNILENFILCRACCDLFSLESLIYLHFTNEPLKIGNHIMKIVCYLNFCTVKMKSKFCMKLMQ